MAGRLSVSAMTLLFFLLLFFCQKKWFWHYLTVFFLILQSTHPRFPKENQLNSEPLAKFLSPHNVMINTPLLLLKKQQTISAPGQTIAFFFIYLALPASHIY